jgi:hypothetical protein
MDLTIVENFQQGSFNIPNLQLVPPSYLSKKSMVFPKKNLSYIIFGDHIHKNLPITPFISLINKDQHFDGHPMLK